LNEELRHEAHHAKCQAQKHDKGAEFARLGFPGEIADDEQHEKHQTADTKVQAEVGDLRLRITKKHANHSCLNQVNGGLPIEDEQGFAATSADCVVSEAPAQNEKGVG
jgi:hypothetical protein